MPTPPFPEIEIKQPVAPKTADDINDIFKELDKEELPRETRTKDKEEKEEKEEKSKKDIEEVDVDEIKLKDVDEDDDLEKLNLDKNDDIEVDSPPRKKELLAKYPDLFKTFPFLEKMMYRDREMMQLFGSYDDAKEIAEKADVFNNFETQLLSGNTEEILREVKNADEKAFNIIVDDYLPTLAKVDKDAYFHVVGNLNKRLIMEMVEEANSSGNEDLKQAALLVNQFVFGNSKFTAPTNRVTKEDKTNSEKDEAEQERLSFVKERFETARDDLQLKVDNTLKATISEYIDPKGVMSSYVKKNAVIDAMKILASSIANDPTTVKNLDRLWRAAFTDKFSRESLGKIQSFYLSRAKGNLKNAIVKARTEALKDLSPKSREKEEVEEETPSQRRTLQTGRPSQPRGKNEMKKGESVTDFFMRD